MIRTFAARHLGGALLFVCCTAAAHADPPATPTPIPEIARTVTSDRTESTLRNATRTTFVVTRDDIVRNGYRTIGDALATVPGVEIERYGTIGQNVSYGIRGSSSAQVLVLVDGLPAAGTLANSVQFGTMSVANVRRVEVVEGGGSTLFGSGAVGGIINVITDGSSAPAFVQASIGTFGDREFRAESHGLAFDRIVAANAFALPPSESFGGPNPITRDNSDFEGSTLRYGADRRLGAIDASLRLSFESDHLGAAGFFPYLSETSREDDVNQNGSLAFTRRGASSGATLQVGGGRQQLQFACNEAVDANCLQQFPSLSTEARELGSFRDVVQYAAGRTIYGADFSAGNVREDAGDGSTPSPATLVQTAGYVQQTFSTRNGSYYAGIRAERDGTLGGEFSPSVGALMQIGAALTVRANAATAFRAPDASELYFPGFGNPSLVAERARVADLSIEDAALFGGVTAGWFTNDTRNLIVTENVGTLTAPRYEPLNIDDAHIAGFTLQAASRPVHGVAATLAVTNLYRASDVSTGSRLPNDPVFTTSLRLDVAPNPRSAFAGAGMALTAAGMRAPGYEPLQPPFYQSGPYSTFDAYARVRAGAHLVLSARGFNIGNERYAQVSGYPMPGRTLLVELSTK